MKDSAPSANGSSQIDADFCIARLQHTPKGHNQCLGAYGSEPNMVQVPYATVTGEYVRALSYSQNDYVLYSRGLYPYGLHSHGHTVMVYTVMAYVFMDCIGMAYVFMDYIAMAHIVMTYR